MAKNVNIHNTLTHESVVCCVWYGWDGNGLATGSNRLALIFDTKGQSISTFSVDGDDGGCDTGHGAGGGGCGDVGGGCGGCGAEAMIDGKAGWTHVRIMTEK